MIDNGNIIIPENGLIWAQTKSIEKVQAEHSYYNDSELTFKPAASIQSTRKFNSDQDQ